MQTGEEHELDWGGLVRATTLRAWGRGVAVVQLHLPLILPPPKLEN